MRKRTKGAGINWYRSLYAKVSNTAANVLRGQQSIAQEGKAADSKSDKSGVVSSNHGCTGVPSSNKVTPDIGENAVMPASST